MAAAEAARGNEPDAEKRKYPGGAFDPLGFSKDAKVMLPSGVLYANSRPPCWRSSFTMSNAVQCASCRRPNSGVRPGSTWPYLQRMR